MDLAVKEYEELTFNILTRELLKEKIDIEHWYEGHERALLKVTPWQTFHRWECTTHSVRGHINANHQVKESMSRRHIDFCLEFWVSVYLSCLLWKELESRLNQRVFSVQTLFLGSYHSACVLRSVVITRVSCCCVGVLDSLVQTSVLCRRTQCLLPECIWQQYIYPWQHHRLQPTSSPWNEDLLLPWNVNFNGRSSGYSRLQ